MRLDHLLSKEDKSQSRWLKSLRVLFNFEGAFVKRGFSSAGRAPALQAGGQGFDSLNLHHWKVWENGLIAQLVRALG